jgi:hypothetical protein
MARLDVDHVYVIHVRKGAEDRAASIERQLTRFGIAFEYVLEGDLEDLTPALLDLWFAGPMHRVHPSTSCCYKHLVAYDRMRRDDRRNALILEDDIFLDDDFVTRLNASLAELRSRPDAHPDEAFISLENSGLGRMDGVSAGRTLYRNDHGRDTGAYWLSRTAAMRFLDQAEADRVSLATPHFHNTFFVSGAVELWWREPTIAEQGSHSGKFDSLLTPRRTGALRRPRWILRKAFQRYLRPLLDRLLRCSGDGVNRWCSRLPPVSRPAPSPSARNRGMMEREDGP